MIGVVIPQMLFAGAMLKLKGVSGAVSKMLVAGYWGHTALTERLDAATQDLLISPPEYTAGSAVGVLLAHVGVYATVTALLLARKDGPGGVRRMLGRALTTLFARKPAERPAVPQATGEEPLTSAETIMAREGILRHLPPSSPDETKDS